MKPRFLGLGLFLALLLKHPVALDVANRVQGRRRVINPLINVLPAPLATRRAHDPRAAPADEIIGPMQHDLIGVVPLLEDIL